jgi:hypothetical protein
MSDATTAARQRVDQALAALERKVLELKARPASAPRVGDDDLFARTPSQATDSARLAELEAAGRLAQAALAASAQTLRGLLAAPEATD